MKNKLMIIWASACVVSLFLSCASCKKTNSGVELKGYIRAVAADSFADYVLECDDGSQYRLKYDGKSGLTKKDADKNTGYKVCVSGSLEKNVLTVLKIERVD